MPTETLYTQLQHKNPVLRGRAIKQLVTEPTETTVPKLVALLAAEDATLRQGAREAMVAIGPAAIPAIAEELMSSDVDRVRANCVQTLAEMARFFSRNYPGESFPAIAVTALKKAMDDANPGVKVAAVSALSIVGQPALEAFLSVVNTTDNVTLQVSVIQAIVSLNVLKGNPKAAEVKAVVTAIAADETADSYVRETARSALTRMGAANVDMRH